MQNKKGDCKVVHLQRQPTWGMRFLRQLWTRTSPSEGQTKACREGRAGLPQEDAGAAEAAFLSSAGRMCEIWAQGGSVKFRVERFCHLNPHSPTSPPSRQDRSPTGLRGHPPLLGDHVLAPRSDSSSPQVSSSTQFAYPRTGPGSGKHSSSARGHHACRHGLRD